MDIFFIVSAEERLLQPYTAFNGMVGKLKSAENAYYQPEYDGKFWLTRSSIERSPDEESAMIKGQMKEMIMKSMMDKRKKVKFGRKYLWRTMLGTM